MHFICAISAVQYLSGHLSYCSEAWVVDVHAGPHRDKILIVRTFHPWAVCEHMSSVSVPRRCFPVAMKHCVVSMSVIGCVDGSWASPGNASVQCHRKCLVAPSGCGFLSAFLPFTHLKEIVIASSSALNHWEEMETFVTCNIFAVTITTSAETAPFYPILLSMWMDDLSVLPHGFLPQPYSMNLFVLFCFFHHWDQNQIQSKWLVSAFPARKVIKSLKGKQYRLKITCLWDLRNTHLLHYFLF